MMNLAERDIYFIHIQNEIDIRKKMLLEKQKKLNEICKQNHFLEIVKDDYMKYSNVIIQQKQEQLRALELLKDYLHQLSVSGNLSKQNIQDSMYEQKKLLREIKKIRKNLDDIITTLSTF